MAGGARDPRRPEVLDNRRRQELAYKLFIAGASYQQIADSPDPARPGQKLYANKGSAHHAVDRAIERHSGMLDVEELRKVELLRLDALQRAHWPKAMQGDSWSTLRIKELMEHRARIAGLFQPVRQQIEVLTTDVVAAAIAQLEREIAAEAALEQGLIDESTGDPVE